MRLPLLLSLASCLVLAAPAFAGPDPFADFRIPDHSWTSGAANASFASDHTLIGSGNETNRTSGLHSSLSTSVSRTHDSDALQHQIIVGLVSHLSAQNGHTSAEYLSGSGRSDQYMRDAVEDWAIRGSLRAYPWQAPVGMWLSAIAQGDYAQIASRADTRSTFTGPIGPVLQEQRQTRAVHFYANTAELDVSAGVGRVRDATVVYDVHLLEERLQDAGALSRPLSQAAREKLAALEYVSPFYSAAHDRPTRFIWRDIERILREDGALREQGLDAYSLLRALEGTGPVRRPARRRGWFFGALAQARTEHSVIRIDQRSDVRVTDPSGTIESSLSSGERTVRPYDAFALGGQAEYHRPLGWRWQVDAAGQLTGPVRPGERGIDLETAALLQWFVADRWAASLSFAQARQYFYPRGGITYVINPVYTALDQWDVSYGAGIAYYLEDRTTISASFQEQQDRGTGIGFHHFGRNGLIQLGISYRFLGGLDAPGLIEPVRRIH